METLGEWYRDHALIRDDLIEIEMPYTPGGEIRIDQELFSWKLYHGKKYIECSTELQARYLKAFLEARVNRIRMPQEEVYLAKIVPDLESLMRNINRIFNDHTEFILNETRKQKLLDLAYYKLMKEGWEAEEKLFPYIYEESENDEGEDEENDEKVEESQSSRSR